MIQQSRRANKYGEWKSSGVKVCNSCGQTLPIEMFHMALNKKLGRRYPLGYCRPCSSRINASRRRSSDKCKAVNRDTRLRYKFGIGADEYELLLAKQNGCCAICGSDSSWGGRRLAVDHCHNTGRVRGLLCSACNTGIGKLKDSPELLHKALEYLRLYGDA